MIRTVGHIHFRGPPPPGQGGFGAHWRYSASEIVISCDEPGCTKTITPRGLEHNGPVIECFYGVGDWHLAEVTLCPMHRPPPTPGEGVPMIRRGSGRAG